MALFEVFARERRELSNSELARLLDLPESSCSDLVRTLYEGGYLTRTARSRRFYPTGRLLAIAREISGNDPLFAAGAEAVELLGGQTGETAFAGRLEAGAVRIVACQESRHALRYTTKVGDRMALHVSALGKALLACVPPEETARQLRLKALKALTPHTVTDMKVLERQVEAIRHQGWVLVENEGVEGVAALAVAGMIGGEPMAVSLAGPTERVMRNREQYLAALKEVERLVFSVRTPA
jgi:DNA-binding IclR family transcriptional regulator